MANETDNTKRTAAQRLEDLERGIMEAYRVLDNVVRDLMTIKDAIKLLGNKTDAIAKASLRGQPLSDENLTNIMVETNVAELKAKADDLVNRGFLKASEEVDEKSFVVGREIDNEGKVANPRLQFAYTAVPAATQEKLKGTKSGDIVAFSERQWKFEVLEVYTIQNPEEAREAAPADQAPAAETPAAEQAAPEAAAPATESSTQTA